jgi:hypothetical protein
MADLQGPFEPSSAAGLNFGRGGFDLVWRHPTGAERSPKLPGFHQGSIDQNKCLIMSVSSLKSSKQGARPGARPKHMRLEGRSGKDFLAPEIADGVKLLLSTNAQPLS